MSDTPTPRLVDLLEQWEYSPTVSALIELADQLERELAEARRELEQAKSDRNRAAMDERNKYLPQLQAMATQLTAHKEVLGMCREIIEGCINNQPASEGGGMYYERFDGDGNYSGVEHVDPAAIYQATLDELHKVLTAIAKLMEGSK